MEPSPAYIAAPLGCALQNGITATMPNIILLLKWRKTLSHKGKTAVPREMVTAEIEVNILLKLFRNKLFIGAMCLLLAGALAFGLLPQLYGAQSGTTEIVRLRQTVEYGTVITEDMLAVVEVGSYGLPDAVVTDKSEIIGLVAGDTIYAGEYLWRDRFMAQEEYKTATAQTGYGLSEGTYLLTIALPSESSGLAGILRSGDTVDVYGYTDESGSAVASVALTAVSVYKVLNSKLISLDDLDAKLTANPDSDPADYDLAPAYVVFTVNEQQAKVLIGLEKDEALHLTLRETEARP
ncbi:putative Flp pilus assembly protein CpaB [uncultured Eubacteriales bacterium]|uniref:Putative Flp pilus assembly protein CpaB n=1 Tax=uncultured Eubacteriales bacterium TaxID=172733 RepID=A0A212JNL8_9FIRM|nr:putative Flp pilus assembly protein CpaB [uncultured Eubacteriales bacterium]